MLEYFFWILGIVLEQDDMRATLLLTRALQALGTRFHFQIDRTTIVIDEDLHKRTRPFTFFRNVFQRPKGANNKREQHGSICGPKTVCLNLLQPDGTDDAVRSPVCGGGPRVRTLDVVGVLVMVGSPWIFFQLSHMLTHIDAYFKRAHT
eukprot:1195212-Prorocentrum_minimum.AAC.3